MVISCLTQSFILAARRGSRAEYVNQHLIFCWFIVEVTTPPQEPKRVLVFHWNSYLVEHLLSVCDQDYLFLPEPHENSGQIVDVVRALQELVV